MKPRHTLAIVATILLGACVLTTCGQATTEDVSPTSPPSTESALAAERLGSPGKCGDRVCDQAEQEDPSLCPKDCEPTTVPTEALPTEVPATATPIPATAPSGAPAGECEAPKPGDKCGDGVCDEAEQGDPNLCPQDCADAAAAPAGGAALPATGVPDYEPPINVYMILHIDPLGPQESETFKPEQGMYALTREEIDWLDGEAARHGLRFTALYNGWFPQWALSAGDVSQFQALHDAGHEIGSHAHRISYDAATDTWIKRRAEIDLFGRPNYDLSLIHI